MSNEDRSLVGWADVIQLSAEQARTTHKLGADDRMKIVVIHWPDDPDRGPEVYGKTDWTDEDRMAWVSEANEAGKAGDPLLSGAYFILTQVNEPFPVQR